MGARGSRVVVRTTAKHSMADVVADLREFVAKLEGELGEGRAA